MTHTPTPWYFKADVGIVGHWTIWADVDGVKTFIADCHEGDDAKADATHIVRAVNSLPALVKALEAARKFIADEYSDPAAEVDGHWLSAEARPVFDEICDALGSNPTVVLHGPYGWLVKPAGLNEEHWYLSSDPSSGADGEISVPLYATEEQELGALASHKTGG